MENKKIFADGLIYKAPKQGAPEYVKGSISIKVDEFKAFLDKHVNNGWVNLDFLKSQKGKLYFALNEWKPAENRNPAGDMLAGMKNTGNAEDIFNQ